MNRREFIKTIGIASLIPISNSIPDVIGNEGDEMLVTLMCANCPNKKEKNFCCDTNRAKVLCLADSIPYVDEPEFLEKCFSSPLNVTLDSLEKVFQEIGNSCIELQLNPVNLIEFLSIYLSDI